MKNIIIGGAVRAGKSTLACKIVKELNYSLCESDTIVNAFNNAFPQFGILHKTPAQTREMYKPFLFEVLDGFNKSLKYKGVPTVFPGSQFLPEHIFEYKNKDNYIVIFLGIENIKPEKLVSIIKEHDTINDWTYNKSDEKLLNCANTIIKDSKIMKKQCKKYNFYYFNTLKNRQNIFDDIIKLINKENLN